MSINESNDPVIADNAETWRYEIAPRTSAKVQLLTIGRIAVYGSWTGAYGENYIAWCPVPKRDKQREQMLGLQL